MDTLTIIITGGIILTAIVIAFILSHRNTWRGKAKILDATIEHYTKARDELSGLSVNDTPSTGGFSIVSGIVSITIVAIVFATVFLPMMQSQSTSNAVNVSSMNTSTSTPTLSSVWSIAQVILVIFFVFAILTVFGLTHVMVECDSWTL